MGNTNQTATGYGYYTFTIGRMVAVGSPGLPSCHVVVSTNTGGFTLEKTSKFQRSDKIYADSPDGNGRSCLFYGIMYVVYFQKSSCSQSCGNPMAFLSIVGYALNRSISLSLNVFLGDMENSRYLIIQIHISIAFWKVAPDLYLWLVLGNWSKGKNMQTTWNSLLPQDTLPLSLHCWCEDRDFSATL